MVHFADQLPPVYGDIMRGLDQRFAPADCSDELRKAAFEIWDASRDALDARVTARQHRAESQT